MKHDNIEDRLKAAVDNSVPDILDDILSDLKNQEASNMTDISEGSKKRKKRIPPFFRGVIAGAAAIVLVVAGVLAFGSGGGSQTAAVDAIVALDVNPSLELNIDDGDHVVEVKTLNEDAKDMLDDMDLKGTDLKVAVNAIIGAMLKNGYIDELANSVLISVENADDARCKELQSKLASEIEELMNAYSLNGSVMTQTMTENEKVMALADECAITHAKAQLIYDVTQEDPTLVASELAKLSIHEINLVISSRGDAITSVSKTGNASEKAYIGSESALEIALKDAGLKETDITCQEVGMDSEDGKMVYEVEFCYSGQEYEYEIAADNGDVIECSKEKSDHSHKASKANQSSSSMKVTVEEAKKAALEKAGKTEAEITELEIETDDGNYEVEFVSGGTEYSIEINGKTGAIIEYETEKASGSSSAAQSHHSDEHHAA